ncbi:MAG: hypothetical protein RL141_826 [Candidatus Parcubacteria bacterium]|jgi:DNA transformation protein
MKPDFTFHDWVLEDLFQGINGITSRPMFGGFAFYLNKKIFAIIAKNQLYFKADAAAIPIFKKHGSTPFQYTAKDRSLVTMSYWSLPEEILEEPTDIETWIRRAAASTRPLRKRPHESPQ